MNDFPPIMVEISDSDYLSPMRLLQIFAVRFVLEVLGSGGAIWGFSEASGLRDSTNRPFWRKVALSIAAVFLSRWILQTRGALTDRRRRREEFSRVHDLALHSEHEFD